MAASPCYHHSVGALLHTHLIFGVQPVFTLVAFVVAPSKIVHKASFIMHKGLYPRRPHTLEYRVYNNLIIHCDLLRYTKLSWMMVTL